MSEKFERWYLDVVKGHPNNLAKDERGKYIFVGQQYLAFEVATMIEREACKAAIAAKADEWDDRAEEHGMRLAIDAIDERSNAELRGRPLADGPA